MKKDKIILFIIGVLIGAVIATGVFYIYNTSNNCNCNPQMNGALPSGEPPEKPSGEKGEPPAKPGENSSQNNND